MRVHDLSCELAVVNHSLSDPVTTTMPSTATTDPQQEACSSPIHSRNNEDLENKNRENTENIEGNSKKSKKFGEYSKNNGKVSSKNLVVRRERPSRACTQRAVQRMQQAAAAEAALAAMEKKKKATKRRERLARLLKEDEVEEGEEEEVKHSRGSDEEEEEEDGQGSLPSSRQHSNSKVITPLVGEPEPSQLPRWNIRSMWQLASILNFLNVFRPLLNIKVEFSAEEFETALLTPNNTLGEIHMPLLKAIPPVTRVALGQNTWITVLCRKLRDWWHWVAEGELPIVASHGAEIEAYNQLDPGVRVVILKALCDIRVEQEDIRSYIDDSIKHGVHLSAFRKERIGGDSHGVSYWYEDDPVIGHRLYREIRKIEVKRGKGKNVPPIPSSSYQWETVGTNFDEIQEVSEKLFTSVNRTESSLGKKLKNDMLPEIEKVQKRKEKLLKKQHRQALLLDNMIVDGLGGGRSLRDRKPVTYTFDDFDRSINEAIKDTKKKQMSPDPTVSRDFMRYEVATNGRGGGPSQFSRRPSFSRHSSKSPDHDEFGDDHKFDTLDRSNRRRQRPQRYSVRDFVDAVSDNDGDFDDSDDDVVGEVVYDDEYLRQKRRRKTSSSSEGDQEYQWDDENTEDEEEEEEDDFLSASEESDQSRKFKKFSGRTRKETKLRSVGEIQSGLRRSKRATRNRINYQQYEWSESENELKPEKSSGSHEYSHASDNADSSTESQDYDENHENMDVEMKVDEVVEEHAGTLKEEQVHPPEKSSSPGQNQVEGVKKRQFLDLNELAPGSGFDDGSNSMKDEDTDDF